MAVLFDHLDEVERRESPLSPIRPELESDPAFVETDDPCPDDSCSGMLWKGNGLRLCGTCSGIGTSTGSRRSHTNYWERYWENRPHYHSSGRARLVGSFKHEWVSQDE